MTSSLHPWMGKQSLKKISTIAPLVENSFLLREAEIIMAELLPPLPIYLKPIISQSLVSIKSGQCSILKHTG